MAKQKTATNSQGEEGKVLEIVPQVPASEVKAKTKKNQAITVDFIKLSENGEHVTTKDAAEAQGLKILTKAGETTVLFSALDSKMLYAAAAFGLNTTLRNAHNSTEHSGGDGVKALDNRLRSIMSGTWKAVGDGSDDGIPLVIEAMIRAKRDAGAYVENMEDKWIEQYRSLDKEGKAAWTKTMSAKKPIEIALLLIKAERATAKASKAQGQAGTAEADSDF